MSDGTQCGLHHLHDGLDGIDVTEDLGFALAGVSAFPEEKDGGLLNERGCTNM